MRVTVKRDSGLIATASKFQLIVDNEKIEKIKNNETVELAIPKEKASVKISQLDAKSNEVPITDGDELVLSDTEFGTTSRLLMMVALIVVLVAQNGLVQLIAIVNGILLFALVASGRKPNYKLEKVLKNE